MPKDCLFTWKADKWPYEKLRALVDEFSKGRKVTELWRVQAHKMVRTGDAAYMLKQGTPPRGIFAIGTVTGPARENREAIDGEGRWQVPITFRTLVDPTKKLLVSERELLLISTPASRWRTQASGVREG